MAAIITELATGPTATVPRRIREAIGRSGRSLRSIADDIGTSPSRLSTYATGKVQPSAAMLIAIEQATA